MGRCERLAVLLLTVTVLFASNSLADDPAKPSNPSNRHFVIKKVQSGCFYGPQPEGPEDFQHLADSGIRTIISVDGATPKVADATSVGLRYVHLPLGYDGVSAVRRLELAKAFETLPRPIYVHCHHGKHRAPTAAAVGLISLREISVAQGQSIQASAGTSPRYQGLLQSVLKCTPLTAQQLEAVEVEFTSEAPTQPIVTMMVHLDEALLELESRQNQNWAWVDDSTTGTSAEVRLKELFQEYRRGDEYKQAELLYQKAIDEAWKLSTDLQTAVENLNTDHFKAAPVATQKLQALKSHCTACHAKFRD
jgi:protein tyrosine phosphatase (PTP) superfamily phosphohydrolase (DUF442 family)